MNNRYYLMRHGESLANRRGLIVSRPENALNDFGLTSQGAEQVMQTALKTRLVANTLIVSSDFKRAYETAEIMQSVVDVQQEIEFDSALRERNFGQWELQDHANYEIVWQNDLTRPNELVNGVEPVNQVLERGLGLIQRLEQDNTGRNILLVGHGDVLQILLAHHYNVNPRFHRSLSHLGNADIRSLSQLELASKITA